MSHPDACSYQTVNSIGLPCRSQRLMASITSGSSSSPRYFALRLKMLLRGLWPSFRLFSSRILCFRCHTTKKSCLQHIINFNAVCGRGQRVLHKDKGSPNDHGWECRILQGGLTGIWLLVDEAQDQPAGTIVRQYSAYLCTPSTEVQNPANPDYKPSNIQRPPHLLIIVLIDRK